MSVQTMTAGHRTRAFSFLIAGLIALLLASVLVSGVSVAQRALVAAAPEAEATILNGLVSIVSETARAALRYVSSLFSWLPK